MIALREIVQGTYPAPTDTIDWDGIESELTAPLRATIADLYDKLAKADVLRDRVLWILGGGSFTDAGKELIRHEISDYDAAPVATSTDTAVEECCWCSGAGIHLDLACQECDGTGNISPAVAEEEPINEFAVLTERVDALDSLVSSLWVNGIPGDPIPNRLDDLDMRVTKLAIESIPFLWGNLQSVFAEIRDIKEKSESTDDPEYDTDDMPAVSKRMAAAARRAYKQSYGQTHERGRWKLAVQAALVQQGRRQDVDVTMHSYLEHVKRLPFSQRKDFWEELQRRAATTPGFVVSWPDVLLCVDAEDWESALRAAGEEW